MLVEGYSVIYKIALTIIKITEPYLQNKSYEESLNYLTGKKQLTNLVPDEFCQLMNSFSISEEDIVSLEMRFMQ